MNAPSVRCWSQLFDSASSTGAHLEEAEAGTTKRHGLTLRQGALREMREANYWLKVIIAGKLAGWQKISELTNEAPQLVAILTVIVKKAEAELDNEGN